MFEKFLISCFAKFSSNFAKFWQCCFAATLCRAPSALMQIVPNSSSLYTLFHSVFYNFVNRTLYSYIWRKGQLQYVSQWFECPNLTIYLFGYVKPILSPFNQARLWKTDNFLGMLSLLSPVSCLPSPVSRLLSHVSCLKSPVSCLSSPVLYCKCCRFNSKRFSGFSSFIEQISGLG